MSDLVFRAMEFEVDAELLVVAAALNHFDGHLRARIAAFQRRLQTARRAQAAELTDLTEEELLVVTRRLQEQGRALKELCRRHGFMLDSAEQEKS